MVNHRLHGQTLAWQEWAWWPSRGTTDSLNNYHYQPQLWRCLPGQAPSGGLERGLPQPLPSIPGFLSSWIMTQVTTLD